MERKTQAQRTEATREALIAAARKLFTERGYEQVGTEEIVRAAGVTRGALYHHYGDKASLLEAVYNRIEAESTERVARIVLGSELHSPLQAMKAGIEAFLEECEKPELRQIALHDAPAIEAGEIRPVPVKPTAHLLMGALDEAAMLLARDERPEARMEVTEVLVALLDSFAVGHRN
jgi:AcrR family transcriptional regulator